MFIYIMCYFFNKKTIPLFQNQGPYSSLVILTFFLAISVFHAYRSFRLKMSKFNSMVSKFRAGLVGSHQALFDSRIEKVGMWDTKVDSIIHEVNGKS
ncbi:hypothetical protein SLEP1_g7105 [Rubroshorea leprosula]|uniref:ATP synthase F0 subunit 8 n=1 Tax=Rubroshorea leprosula TaxID=152421 RepID=A0AAV5I6J4_9ROSI|nr:hypothetical protein SLEP1_g7105 [Rubroshorea leprosula]